MAQNQQDRLFSQARPFKLYTQENPKFKERAARRIALELNATSNNEDDQDVDDIDLEGHEDLEAESLTVSKQEAYDMLVQDTLDYPKNREQTKQKARAHRADMQEM